MEIITKTRFEKDIKKQKKRQKDFLKLETVLDLILTENKLSDKYKNHPLVGNWKPCWGATYRTLESVQNSVSG